MFRTLTKFTKVALVKLNQNNREYIAIGRNTKFCLAWSSFSARVVKGLNDVFISCHLNLDHVFSVRRESEK